MKINKPVLLGSRTCLSHPLRYRCRSFPAALPTCAFGAKGGVRQSAAGWTALPTSVAASGFRTLVPYFRRCIGGSHACPLLPSLHRGFARLSPTSVAASGVRTLVPHFHCSTPAILLLVLPEIARSTLHPAKLQVLVLQTFNGVTRLAITCTFALIELTPYRFYEITVRSQVLVVGGESGVRTVAIVRSYSRSHDSDYHARTYEHALQDVRFTTRSHPASPY